MTDYLLAAVIVFFASVVEASFGFGGGLIAIPLLSLIFGIQDSVALFLVFQFFKGTLLFWGWRHVAFKPVIIIALFLPLGVYFGYAALTSINAKYLEIGLAFYLLYYVSSQTWLKMKVPMAKLPQKPVQAATGLLGGFFLGLTGTGGPIIVTYLKNMLLSKETFRFTIIFLLFITNASRMLMGTSEEFFNSRVQELILYCTPAYIAALLVGYRLPRFLTDRQFSIAIHTLLVMAAAALLYKASL